MASRASTNPTQLTGFGRQLAQPKQAELVADDLRTLIVTGAAVGDALPPERVLIERFGVSRPCIREALRILEFEGLIAIRRGVQGGAVIRPPGLHDLTRLFGTYLQRRGAMVAEAYELRALVEGRAARLAAARPAESGERLEACLAAEAGLIDDSGSPEAVAVKAVDFHRVLLQQANDETLLGVGSLLDSVLEWHAATSLERLATGAANGQTEALRASHAGHVAIVEAIKAGDADRAERRVCRHLEALRFSATPDGNEPISVISTTPDD